MEPVTITASPAVIGGAVAGLVALVSAVFWFGKLSNRVSQLEKDTTNLKKGWRGTHDTLNQHVGYHRGMSQISAMPSQPGMPNELAGQVRSNLMET